MVQNIRKIIRDISIVLLISISMVSFSSKGSVKGHNEYTNTEAVLLQQTRNDIYKLIEKNEGIHFRKICRELDKKTGVVQHHINVLESNKLIKIVKDGHYKRFFVTRKNSIEYQPQDELNCEQRKLRETIISSMNRKTPNKIIRHILENIRASHHTLAKISRVSPQAITFHCQRLQKIGLIKSVKIGRQKIYSLTDDVLRIIDYIRY